MKVKLLIFASIILILGYVVVIPVDEWESTEIQSIIIEINPFNYSINGNSEINLISLVNKELEKYENPEEVSIRLYANDNIPYQDIINAMNILKENGFGEVGLVAQQE